MRPRHLKIHPQRLKKLNRLKKEAEIYGEYRVAKRIHAVILNSDELSSGDITSLLKSPRSKVSEWLRNYEDFGYEGLLEGQRSGRPCLLSPSEKEELSDIIESGPIAYGYLSGVWTSPMIARAIKEEFGIQYDPRHVLRILNELGFSHQRPKRKLAKADPIKQNQWRRYIYPNIKKKRRARKLL